MESNISDVLNYEIKKEIADRYFGFRKLIEEDKLELLEKIRQYSFILEKRISFDLIRIYVLLKDEGLIQDFLDLVKLEKKFFYDPFLASSQHIQERVFEGVRMRGLTRFGCFCDLVEDCYERLVYHARLYGEKFQELMDSQATIDEEIKMFYRQNDFGSIMGFLHSLGDAGLSAGMEGGMEVGLLQELEKKMDIEAPPPIEHYLPPIPSLPEYKDIAKDVKQLLNKAYPLHDEVFFDKVIARSLFPLWR
ncbi:MAG: hypothetical protein OEL55_01700 [Desulfobulbaceae bacterium]|nr:hypothetical protein [Desulfobulbaceae bacterium]